MTPFFSVIVPTRDRPDRLVRCLRALAQLDYPGDAFEVVVVDDGSRIAIEQVVEALQTEFQVSVLRTPACGPAAARNVGVANARGDYVAFTDDDCIPRVDWLDSARPEVRRGPRGSDRRRHRQRARTHAVRRGDPAPAGLPEPVLQRRP